MKERDIEFIGSLGEHAVRQAAAVKARAIDPRFAPQFCMVKPESHTLECAAGKRLKFVKRKVRGDLQHR